MNSIADRLSFLWRRPLWVAAAVVVLAVALRLAMFAVGCLYVDAFDDECLIALQAMQIAHGDFSLHMLGQPYVFPLEAYLMAPLVAWLPRTAFGARVMACGFGMGTLGVALLVLRRCGRWRDIWPGALLVLLGSPFLIMLQFGCALPGYPTMMLLLVLTTWFALRQAAAAGAGAGWAFLAGAAGGLACSESFLVLPVLGAAAGLVGWPRQWRITCRALPAFAVGALVGLIPYLLSRLFHGDASGTVTGTVSWREALARLTGYLLPLVSNVTGVGCPVYPGNRTRILHAAGVETVVGGLVLLILLAGVLVGVTQWWRGRGKPLPPLLYFSAIAWGCLLLFLFSARAHSRTYRYLMPLAMSFPFVVACLYPVSRGVWRKGLAASAILLTAFSLLTTVLLLRHWARPAFARELGSHDLTPVLDGLRERGIRHAYASYEDAYRITFKTDRHILCAQPYNERFPGWPLPFKAAVDASPQVAYVLAPGRKLPPKRFIRHLAQARLAAARTRLGAYDVFTDFRERGSTHPGSLIPPVSLRASASHAPDIAGRMVDGTTTFWRCEGSWQTTGMWVAATWDAPHLVRAVAMAQGEAEGDHPTTVNLFLRDDTLAWVQAATNLTVDPAPLSLIHNHPVYGMAEAHLVLPEPRRGRGVKIEIAIPRSDRAWTVSDLRVFGTPMAGTPDEAL
jgi:hypothetical protein